MRDAARVIEIARTALVVVTGAGESMTRVDVGPVHVTHTTSDYQACVNAMRSAAAQRYPYAGIPPLVPDFNAADRARTEVEYISRNCGRPQPSPPPRLRRSVP